MAIPLLAPDAALFLDFDGTLIRAHPALRAENKGLSIAFHYRGAVAEEPRLREILAAALALRGRAIRVGAPRTTHATEGLSDPSALRAWLARSAAALKV